MGETFSGRERGVVCWGKCSAPTRVVYCYGVYDPSYGTLKADLHQGLPTEEQVEEWTESKPHLLIVLDDLMGDVLASRDVEKLFTRGCHHRGMSVMFLTQNLFAQGQVARNLALNTSYLILFKNVRDRNQMAYLGRQMYPSKSKSFMRAYEDATNRPYGYLIVDLTPRGKRSPETEDEHLVGDAPHSLRHRKSVNFDHGDVIFYISDSDDAQDTRTIDSGDMRSILNRQLRETSRISKKRS